MRRCIPLLGLLGFQVFGPTDGFATGHLSGHQVWQSFSAAERTLHPFTPSLSEDGFFSNSTGPAATFDMAPKGRNRLSSAVAKGGGSFGLTWSLMSGAYFASTAENRNGDPIVAFIQIHALATNFDREGVL